MTKLLWSCFSAFGTVLLVLDLRHHWAAGFRLSAAASMFALLYVGIIEPLVSRKA